MSSKIISQKFSARRNTRKLVALSGKTLISVYLPERLRRELVREAKRRAVSVNTVVVERLAQEF